MKKIYFVLLCLGILVGCADKKDVNLKLLDQEAVLIEDKSLNKNQYTIDVTLNPENHTIGGSVDILVKNNSQDDWDELYLRDYTSMIQEASIPMTFHKVSDGQNDLDVIIGDDLTILRLPLVTPLKAGSSMNLHIEYTAYIMKEGYGRFNYAIAEDIEQLRYTLGNFYPVLSYYENSIWVNHPLPSFAECFYTPVSDYVVKVTTPQQFEISATGSLIEEKILDQNLVSRTFMEKNVRDFAMSVASDYQELTAEVDGIIVRSYFYEGNEAMGQYALDEGVQAIKLFNRYLGKYPYSEVDIAAVPILPGGGMEFPGHVMVLQRYYEGVDYRTLSKVVVHELAHQWFYGIVGNDEFDMPWLDESTASAMEYVYMNYYQEETYKKTVEWNEKMKHDSNTDFVITKAYDEYDEESFGYINAVYSIGGQFLNRVRLEMGNENFMRAMQEYVNTYAFKEAKTENLIEILNKHSEKSLLPLYEKHIEPVYFE